MIYIRTNSGDRIPLTPWTNSKKKILEHPKLKNVGPGDNYHEWSPTLRMVTQPPKDCDSPSPGWSPTFPWIVTQLTKDGRP